jgi:hypothetical protein
MVTSDPRDAITDLLTHDNTAPPPRSQSSATMVVRSKHHSCANLNTDRCILKSARIQTISMATSATTTAKVEMEKWKSSGFMADLQKATRPTTSVILTQGGRPEPCGSVQRVLRLI